MKIAIQTLVGHHNYGCLLQAYALQTTLEGLGHNVEIINRRENVPGKRLMVKRMLRFAVRVVQRYILLNKSVLINDPFDCLFYSQVDFTLLRKFSVSKLHYTRLFRSSSSLAKYVKRRMYDAFVVGSDQVWREIYAPNILDSFLGYLPEEDKSIKISYAASFGTDEQPILNEKITECVKLAKRFKAISVREKSGIGIVSESFGMDAVQVLDPTLLLSSKDYSCLVGDNTIGEGMAVSYMLDLTGWKNEIVDIVLAERNVGRFDLMDCPLNDNGVMQRRSVEDWLSAIRNANIVVTDSFHGCVFSIIFQKPFICIGNKERGSARFESLLSMFRLEDRLVTSFDDFEARKEDLMKGIDYSRVYAILEEKRKESMDFLQKSLMK